MWRLRSRIGGQEIADDRDLIIAIFTEAGTDPRTEKRYRHTLTLMEWITSREDGSWLLTGDDLK